MEKILGFKAEAVPQPETPPTAPIVHVPFTVRIKCRRRFGGA
jgi:hypothetical protein